MAVDGVSDVRGSALQNAAYYARTVTGRFTRISRWSSSAGQQFMQKCRTSSSWVIENAVGMSGSTDCSNVGDMILAVACAPAAVHVAPDARAF